MAKGGHRRPAKRKKKTARSNDNKEIRNLKRAKDRERQSRKSKSLTRQMRGMKWDEEYGEEFEEELDDV